MILAFVSSSAKNIIAKILSVFFVVPCLLVTGCFENPGKAVLTTSPVVFQSNGSATVTGTIQSDGGSEIFQKGFCMGTNPHPTIADGPGNSGGGNESFEMNFNLMPGTTTYIRAYAANGAGVAYGNEVEFSMVGVTLVDLFLETASTAFARVNVNSSQSVLSRGVCWNTSGNPTVDDDKTDEGTGTGIFTTNITGLDLGTTYYVRAYAISDDGVFYSDAYPITTGSIPTVTTKPISNIGTFMITTGGDLINGSGGTVGVCWSTSPLPTIADHKTVDYCCRIDNTTSAYTSFYSEPTGLLPGVTYYIRAYVTAAVGTGYGNQVSVTMPSATVVDVDGNPYSSTTIGTQVWLVENLKTTKFSNGDAIAEITNDIDLRNTSSPDWMYYAYDDQFNFPYGKLYNWFAVTDARNVCPDGWHVPSNDEWMAMIDYEGGIPSAGNKILEAGQMHWAMSNNSSDNSSGLTILPGGGQNADYGSFPLNSEGLFWTTASSDADHAWSLNIFDFNEKIIDQVNLKKSGFSVRCVKD